MQIEDFNYELPEELIAQQPLAERDASRMMVDDRQKKSWRDSRFLELPSSLRPGDVLVANNTRVFPARLVGEREPSGGRVELLLLREVQPNTWEALTRPARRLRVGARLKFGAGELVGEVVESHEDGMRVMRFACDGDLAETIERIGRTPLPPYIRRPDQIESDRARYQTIYASSRGAIAAPTAGLHFTEQVLQQVANAGATLVEITLHVGYGTFEPVHVRDVSRHRVAPEWYSISTKAAAAINHARSNQGRVVAIGTTTTRALEAATNETGILTGGSGAAALTIVPGYEFRVVDALLTNFHLPCSSLLILVSAFAGRELVLDAYRHAVEERYRFYSYGDCMLII